MKHHAFFNPRRLLQLLRNDLRINQRPMLIAAATILVFWTLLTLVGNLSPSLYIFVLYFGGFIVTSRAFKELHDPELAYHYLTLPCSNFERFLSKWLTTSIGYAVALLGLFYVFIALRTGFGMFLLHRVTEPFDLFNFRLLNSLGVYIVLHSMVFLGAVLFKRHALLKTSFFFGSLTLILFMTIGWLGIHFFPYWDPNALHNLTPLPKIAHFLFWIALAPFFWFVTYLRIAEYEIN